MELRGWDYTGRNIGPELHKQYCTMIDCLSDSSFINHRNWSNAIQEDLATRLCVSSSGVVRTIKKIFEDFGLLNSNQISSKVEINPNFIITKRGSFLYYTATLEAGILSADSISKAEQEKAMSYVKMLYEEIYCDALKGYYYDNGDGTFLSPLRATLKAVAKYGKLDKWEWYLMNTCIRHDDNTDEENKLDDLVSKYRKGLIQVNMNNVVEKPKGHQYIPQYFEYAGLLHVIQRPDWSIGPSNRHKEVKDEVLSSNFLDRLHEGGAM